MSPQEVIDQIEANREVFKALLSGVTASMADWKPAPDHWCVLEIVCHLCDEEREDFRARIKSTLEDPQQPLTEIDPQGWVTDRSYAEQDFASKLSEFLESRSSSIAWLRSLERPSWANTFQHEKLGPLSARLFLENWLAHDYLHIRQINRRKYEYLRAHASHTLGYAGDW